MKQKSGNSHRGQQTRHHLSDDDDPSTGTQHTEYRCSFHGDAATIQSIYNRQILSGQKKTGESPGFPPFRSFCSSEKKLTAGATMERAVDPVADRLLSQPLGECFPLHYAAEIQICCVSEMT